MDVAVRQLPEKLEAPVGEGGEAFSTSCKQSIREKKILGGVTAQTKFGE